MIDVLEQFWRAYLYSSNGSLSGMAITLWLLVLSVSMGFFISIFLAVARVSSRRWLSVPLWIFGYVFRGTPLYVQILFIYAGIYSLDFVKDTPPLAAFFQSGFNCLVLALTLNTVAYTTEIFAGAIRATSAGEIEAARAYGMTRFAMYRRVILPSALRRALPAYSNEVILMLHATSLAFTATVPDILKIARDANSATYQTFASYGLAALLYLCLSFTLIWLFRRFERRTLAYLGTHR
ncbi:ABC transporter permease [Castellaniella daejeonensis]|jgi:histidine transport system permease protein|uniref:Histidine/lysine/arginine/ornithine transport system permease protein HisM n=1 Tax=Castellaniella daejeonensis TaxID=659013 RepID=A0ABP3D545_9BURK|nr:ABC transporter permease [Castellaniella sp.]HET8704608.1 ABC transporter permease [Castellaniella sp.]